jgi:hypothetical protein
MSDALNLHNLFICFVTFVLFLDKKGFQVYSLENRLPSHDCIVAAWDDNFRCNISLD